MLDPILLNDWHPVANASDLRLGSLLASSLLNESLVLWRSLKGEVHAWKDQCPHRGARLSLGMIENDQLICPYHGWQFSTSGQCVHVPALPEFKSPLSHCAKTYRVEEKYGLIWVCLGEPQQPVLPFPEYQDPKLRKVLCGPYEVDTSGPRIVENFIDLAHFPFVHAGILGERPRNEVLDYEVNDYVDEQGGKGVIATKCYFWQPKPHALSTSGAQVEYSFRVLRPLSAILTKVADEPRGVCESISLHIQPLEEAKSRVWIILALNIFEKTEQELREFQDAIFLQDQPIVESQSPKCLPIWKDEELSIRSDRMSVAYRKYLKNLSLQFGVV